jgi:5-methyltetrahydrofolate--homocysteine methyltransferase
MKNGRQAGRGIADAVRSGRVLVSDGAWGTFLQAKGLQPGECPELWNLDRPAEVEDIGRRYIQAGADMIESNSFGGTSFKLKHFGLEGRVAEINEAAARLSRAAAGPERWVIASVGPTGQMLLLGEATEEQLYEAFREQVVALARGGADAVCIETLSAVDEAALAIRAAREHTSCEVIASFTFDRNVRGEYRTLMGVSPADAVRASLDAGAHMVGANCGNGMERMVEVVAEMRAASAGTPILVHANAGLPVNVDGADRFPDTPEDMARLVPALVSAGASAIGGCCGTTPAHIAAIRRAVDALGSPRSGGR